MVLLNQHWLFSHIIHCSSLTSIKKYIHIMGNIASAFKKEKEYRVLMVGYDASGKTNLLQKCLMNKEIFAEHTVGFTVETVDNLYDNISLIIWEVAGHDKIRPLWRHYYPHTNGIIFVIDSHDRERIEQVKDTLFGEILNALSTNKKVPLLILCNKQDLPNALSVVEMKEVLDVSVPYESGKEYYGINILLNDDVMDVIFSYLYKEAQDLNGTPYFMVGTSAFGESDIFVGMDWFVKSMKKNQSIPPEVTEKTCF